MPGGRHDSRSPPRRPPPRRDSRSPPRRGGRGPPRRDSRSPPRRDYGRGRNRTPPRRSRSRGGGGYRGGGDSYRIPPPKHRQEGGSQPAVQITPEMRANSLECEGFLYATMDFTPPNTPCTVSAEVPRSYDGKRCTDDCVLQWNNMPTGWKQCPSDIPDSVKEKVIKNNPWGTHLLVMEDGKAYRTPGCGNKGEPGGLQMIWEFEKGPARLKLQRLGGSQSYWYGKLFIRAPVPT
mmetsp:Transcript_11452/g.21650  ORF Transcript_11452/g.21650 Transcript_11452/m.21650 type:complete len:235 (+) Transcript_11452:51-755(+)